MDGYGPSSYGDGMAGVYDHWYATRGDIGGAVATIASLAADPQAGAQSGSDAASGSALELGIGTGRLALPLAAAGVDVWGIDASDAMLALLRAKPGGAALRVAIGDMAELDLSGLPGGAAARFAVVYVADNTFFNLTTEAAQRRCLGRARQVLAPSGRLAIEAFVPARDAPASSLEARTVELDHVVLTATRLDRDAQTVSGQHIELRESGVRLHPWMIRFVWPEQLDAMANDAGLHLVERWSDWRRSPFTPDDNVHVSLYAATA